MTAAGRKLRLCPFCGSEAEMLHSGSVCVVRCPVCRAEGPVGDITDFIEAADDLTDEAVWEKRTLQAEGAALMGWNGRPWVGAYYPEELEAMHSGDYEVIFDEDKL